MTDKSPFYRDGKIAADARWYRDLMLYEDIPGGAMPVLRDKTRETFDALMREFSNRPMHLEILRWVRDSPPR